MALRRTPAVLLIALVALLSVAFPGGAWASSPSVAVMHAEELDTITFRSGKVIKGEVLEETPTSVRIRVKSYGIEAVTTYDKSDILSIKKGTPKAKRDEPDKSPTKSSTKGDAVTTQSSAARARTTEAAHRIYHILLDGRFGQEISQSPLRDALKDAAKNDADYVIVELNNEWKRNPLEDLPDDAAAFDQLFRAEALHPLLDPNGELSQIYAGKDPPTIVFWVKKAMGGAAFLPLICPNIYFSEDGKMGGIGNLGDLFGSMGDEVVRDKQYSLRMGHAEGVAIRGGYPIEIVHAMTDRHEVYSYRINGGRVQFKNDWPDTTQGWTLLTDDGEGDNADTIQQLARSQGNDTLTLDAKLAQTLGVSKGTVNTMDALVFTLGLSRSSTVIDGQSDRIMDRWESGLASAERRLRELWQEYSQIQVQGRDARERNSARGRQIRKLQDMIKLYRRYEEALNSRRLRLPGEPDLRVIIEQIKLQMLRDR